MASFNKCILIGNLTADPEIRQTQGGTKVCSFSIAVNRRGRDAGCDFINVVAWKEKAEFVAQWFKKGKPILVCGQLQQRVWTDKQGNKRYEYEIIADELSFVASADDAQTAKTEPSMSNQGAIPYIPAGYAADVPKYEEIPGDENLPF